MKKTTLIYSMLFTAAVLSGSACKKTFLDQLPETARVTDNVYKTAADFNTAVVGAYSTLKHNGLYANCGVASALLNLGEVPSDNCDYGYPRGTSVVNVFELEDFNFSLSNINFSNAWTGHYIGISRANTIINRIAEANIDGTLKTKYEAEAKFLRAYFYFNLVRLFGDVQLVTTEFSNPNEGYGIPRTAAAKVYELIISDLNFAEANLPAAIGASDAGRASKWAAKALLGKVYLTQQNFSAAAAKLLEVINSGQFNVTANNYAAVFSATTSFTANKDVILAVQYKSGNIGQGSNIWNSNIPWGASLTTAYWGVSSGTGDGYLRPTADFENAYEAGDLRKAATMANSYQNGATTVLERYVVKYRQNGILFGDADIDFPILRYADVLLMYAEALTEQNQVATAIPFINQVRTRAGLPSKPITLTQDEARLLIEAERRVELAFEGHRWFDLVRTGRYLPVMTSKGYATKAFHKLFPIPQRETDLNKNLTQNPGY
ncbi:MAG TPA: RagB/SusD family nutrient uptake outer membrane protein [Chitinophagaceae bacterium]|nr:RagB/SusD family nutrient uptake outer membrane protein [Chitinophagaceae bacterium]